MSDALATPGGDGGTHGARDAWSHLARLTPARIALGRTGAGLPTREVLGFALAHAQARDAVHMPFDAARIDGELRAQGLDTLIVASAAADRSVYLRRPDLGRRLDDASRLKLTSHPARGADLLIVVADGLSAAAVHAHAASFIAALRPWILRAGWSLGPVVIAREARVALGDEAGQLLGAKACALLVGERPGLSSPDSLGAYLTFGPVVGRNDAERNCISNIRSEGLAYDHAAFKLAWLIDEAFKRALTGVALKDESDLLMIDGKPPVAVLG